MCFRYKIVNRIRDFFIFLKSPHLEEQEIDTKGFKIFKIIVQYFIIILICSFFMNVLLYPIKQLDICPRLSLSYRKLLPIVYIVLAAPIAEEFISRLPLLFTRYNILISISLLLLYLFRHNIYLLVALPFISSFLWYLLYTNILNIRSHLEYFWENHFIIVFYFLAVSFGLLHINSYRIIAPVQYLLLPLLVLPQISSGVILSYIRVRYQNGMIITIMIHILFNLSITGLSRIFET